MAIELSQCGVDSIGWENTFDAFAGEFDYFTALIHWNRAECLSFAANTRTHATTPAYKMNEDENWDRKSMCRSKMKQFATHVTQ